MAQQLESGRRAGRSLVSPTQLVLVFIGGTGGTILRALIAEWMAPGTAIGSLGSMESTICVNLSGAAAIGFLAGFLASGRTAPARSARTQALFGAGLLGGYTTYSVFAADAATLITSQQWLWLLGYAGVTIVGGAALTAGGIWTGRRLRTRRGTV